MFKENKVEKIALLGSGGVIWYGFGKKEKKYKLDIEASKKALESALKAIKKDITSYGYELAFSHLVRVEFGFTKKERELRKTLETFSQKLNVPLWKAHDSIDMSEKYTVYENFWKNKKNKREVQPGETAYDYPFEEADKKLGEAAAVFVDKSTCLLSGKAESEACKGLKENLLTIHNATGADTVCLAKLRGLNYTLGYKILMPNPQDIASFTFTCMDAKTGELLWRNMWPLFNYHSGFGYYIRPSKTPLPKAGWRPMKDKCEQMSPLCKPQEEGRETKNDDIDTESRSNKCMEAYKGTPVWKCKFDMFTSNPPKDVAIKKAPPTPKPKKKFYGKYFGVGATGGDISIDERTGEDFEADFDTGGRLVFGFINGQFSMEMGIGEVSGSTYEHVLNDTFYGLGVKLNLLDIDKYWVSPWIGAEAYVFEGGCVSPAAGLDIKLSENIILRAGKRDCSYTTHKNYYFNKGYGPKKDEDLTLKTIDLIFRFD